MTCEICNFANPKATVTAIILKDNKLLVLKRNEEPFKGKWDLAGGYMNEEETSEFAMRRELQEELGLTGVSLTLMKMVSGYGFWKDEMFPILSHFYLVDIGEQNFTLNTEENSELKWILLSELNSNNLAWDSNQEFCSWLKDNFTYDLDRVRELVKQLDPTAEVKEQSLYKAILCGHVSKIYDGDKLIAMGWIFPRQTLLRYQAVIEDMIVDETYRGKGYGRIVLQELLKWAKDKNIEVVELTTGHHREAAYKLYESEGFTLHDTRHMLKFL